MLKFVVVRKDAEVLTTRKLTSKGSWPSFFFVSPIKETPLRGGETQQQAHLRFLKDGYEFLEGILEERWQRFGKGIGSPHPTWGQFPFLLVSILVQAAESNAVFFCTLCQNSDV